MRERAAPSAGSRKAPITVQDANYDRVLAALEQVIREHGGSRCFCPECVSALAAKALNSLSPHYCVSATNDHAGSPLVVVENAVREAVAALGERPEGRCGRRRDAR